MATRITTADGNFTAAATWATVDTTSELDSEAGTTVLTTSDVDSATSVPGAITVDGVAVKVSRVPNAPTGTMTVTLRNSTDGVDDATLAINVADIPRTDTADSLGAFADYVHGWIFFKFGSPVTLTAAKNYVVRAKTSSANMVWLYRNSTAGNWSRMLRTTTTGAPAVGDKLITTGEHTAAGAKTTRTVTLDNTAATVFGAVRTATFCQSVVICDGGTWIASRAAATALRFVYTGICLVVEGGLLDLGTPASKIPVDSSVIMQADCTTSNDSKWVIDSGGICRTHGAVKQTWGYASANVAAAATTLTMTRRDAGSALGWAIGDDIIIGATSTGANYFQHETRALTNVGGINNLDLTWASGLTYAHTSASPILCPVGNLSRNVEFTGESLALNSSFIGNQRCVLELYYTEFKWGGAGAYSPTTHLGGEGSLSPYCSGGTQIIYGCSFWASSVYPLYINLPEIGAPTYQIDECVGFGSGSGASGLYFNRGAAGGPGLANGSYIRNSLVVAGPHISGAGIRFEGVTEQGSHFEITGNTICSMLGSGMLLNGAFRSLAIDNNTIFSCSVAGIRLNCFTPTKTTFTGNRIHRCAIGIVIEKGDWLFDDTFVIGNNYGISGNGARRLKFTDAAIAGEAGYAQVAGLVAGFPSLSVQGAVLLGQAGGALEVEFDTCTFGVGTAHTQADIGWFLGTGGVLPSYGDIRVILRNCTLASGTEVNLNATGLYSWVRSYNHEGTGAYQLWTNGAADFMPAAEGNYGSAQ